MRDPASTATAVLSFSDRGPTIPPCYDIAAITGYAVTEDGAASFLKCMDASGLPFLLKIPTSIAQTTAGAVMTAASLAIKTGQGEGPEQKITIHRPETFQVLESDQLPDCVLLAVDPGTINQQVLAFHATAARSIAKAFLKNAQKIHQAIERAARKRPHLIIPGAPPS